MTKINESMLTFSGHDLHDYYTSAVDACADMKRAMADGDMINALFWAKRLEFWNKRTIEELQKLH